MNNDKMLELAEVIEQHADRFNMDHVFMSADGSYDEGVTNPDILHDCNTAGCIAGWARALVPDHQGSWTIESAAGLLGLSSRQAQELFIPYDTHPAVGPWAGFSVPFKATGHDAAERLRGLVEGEWGFVNP